MKRIPFFSVLLLTLLIFFVSTSNGAVYTYDPGGPGESNSPSSAYVQLFDPAGTYPSTLTIDEDSFSSFSTSGGALFTLTVDHRGNNNNLSSPEAWGFIFYSDGSTPTSTHYFADSPDSSGYDVVEDFSTFDLSNTGWKFVIQELSAETERGFKVDSVTLSSVPIPGALWLLVSGLAFLVGTSKKRKK